MVGEVDLNYIKDTKGKAVLVELYQEGCVPCERLKPVLELLEQEYGERIDIKRAHYVRGNFGSVVPNATTTPMFALFYDGKLLESFTGARYANGINGERTAVDIAYLQRRIDRLLETHKTILDTIETKLGLSPNSLTILRKRYLRKDDAGNVIETPEEMFSRVAKNIASADSFYGKSVDDVKKTERDFYEIMGKMEFLPNTPTLINAGRDLQQLSACFVIPIEDSIESIFGAATIGALVHKSGGGTGYSFSKLRSEGSRVKTTSGIASGPVSFINAFNMYTEVVKQGGTRRGANMGILRVDHPDIRKFIRAKSELSERNEEIIKRLIKKTGLDYNDPIIKSFSKILIEKTQFNNFNISVALTDRFVEAVEKNDDFELVDPHTEKSSEKVRARKLLEEIVDKAWENGEPGIIFIDRINEYNPTPSIGKIESTNPCGEQPLLAYESCNLGSINLSKFVTKDKKIDYEMLREVVHLGVHFLDNVIDMNNFPIPEIEKITKANRKIGLGVMGFADMLVKLGIAYGSGESITTAEDIMKFIQDEGRKASEKLAKERGVFPNWEESVYNSKSKCFKGLELKLRNATITTIAPTGSLSMIAECQSGIEPYLQLAFRKTVLEGTPFDYIAFGLRDELKSRNLLKEEIIEDLKEGKKDNLPKDLKKVAVTSMDLNPEQHIRIQSAFQKYTDNAVSKTINFPNSASKEDVLKAYTYAHKLGCKGVTVYRMGSRDEEVITIREKGDIETISKKRPKRLLGVVRKEIVGDGKSIFCSVSYFPDRFTDSVIEKLEKEGNPAEIFVNANYFNPDEQSSITALAISWSKRLRSGTPAEEIIEESRNLPPAKDVGYDHGFGDGKEYVNVSVANAMGKALGAFKPEKKISAAAQRETKQTEEKGNQQVYKEKSNFGLCPQCSREGIVHEEGCDHCIYCGYSIKGCS